MIPLKCWRHHFLYLPFFIFALNTYKLHAQSIYHRDMAVEFEVDSQNPLAEVSIGRPNPFSADSRIVSGHSTSQYLSDNEDRLYFLNVSTQTIIVCELKSDNIDELPISVADYPLLKNYWLGPNDELYLWVAKRDKIASRTFLNKLVRFINGNTGYSLDSQFDTFEYHNPPGLINISPRGDIYIERWTSPGAASSQYGKFHNDGAYLGASDVVCKTIDGTEISLVRRTLGPGKSSSSLLNYTNNVTLYEVQFNIRTIRCTTNGSIIMRNWDYDKIPLADKNILQIDKPYVVVFDQQGNETTIDPYEECANSDYSYHSVSCITSNYNGDIYATVVYFNIPGQITGDETIILYRWVAE